MLLNNQTLAPNDGGARVMVCTLQMAAASSYSNNQTVTPVGGITYEFKRVASGWTPTGGAVVVVDIIAATTAQDVAVALVAAISAQASSTVTAVSSGAGLITLMAKASGSAYNVSIGGTASSTYVLLVAGTDSTASGIISPRQWSLGSQMRKAVVDGLMTDTLGGFRVGFSLELASAGSNVPACFQINDEDPTYWSMMYYAAQGGGASYQTQAERGSTPVLAGYWGILFTPGDTISGTISCSAPKSGNTAMLKIDVVHTRPATSGPMTAYGWARYAPVTPKSIKKLTIYPSAADGLFTAASQLSVVRW